VTQLETFNPIWIREMRQSARLARTPVILGAVTAVLGLMMCASGGAASTSAPAAEVGAALFQTFFSLAFAIVAWVGPGVAALTIVSERTGRTWESVVMTGLSARSIVAGKFLASLTYIALYLAALAPVGALPFLFGGVTATEVVTAYALLVVFAVLAVGFGLSVSSGAKSPAMALLVTLPFSAGASLVTYFGLGIGLSFAAHEVWPAVSQGMPVWLPAAYARADFDRHYFVYLLVLPATLAVLLAGFFHAVSVANLSDPSDDRGFSLKRWFIVAALAVAGLGHLLMWTARSEAWILALIGIGVAWLLSLSTLMGLAGEPVGPSRRVLAQWAKTKPGSLRRFLGPGLVRAAVLVVVVGAASALLLSVTSVVKELRAGRTEHALGIGLCTGYGIALLAFLAGFVVFIRSSGLRRADPRALVLLALFLATFGPLLAAAIVGITSSSDNSFVIAAPSPFYAFAFLERSVGLTGGPSLGAAYRAIAGWTALGAVLGALGARRLRTQQRAEEALGRDLERRLLEEDRQAARADTAPS
jgi:hypothetical protein